MESDEIGLINIKKRLFTAAGRTVHTEVALIIVWEPVQEILLPKPETRRNVEKGNNTMLDLTAVDDEKSVLEAMANTIRWENLRRTVGRHLWGTL